MKLKYLKKNLDYILKENLDSKMSDSNEIQVFWKFAESYQKIHGWLSVMVCIFGLSSHFINMLVLTRKNMVNILFK